MKLSQEMIAILAVGATLIGAQGVAFVSLRGEMRHDIDVLREEMRHEMGVLREEMRHEMDVLREEVRHDIDALRADIHDVREDVRQLRDKLLVPGEDA